MLPIEPIQLRLLRNALGNTKRRQNTMPAFKQQKWGEYQALLIPSRDDPHRKFMHVVTRKKFENIPFFWGADIRFDLAIIVPNNYDPNIVIAYEWILYNKKGEEEGREPREVSQGHDTFTFVDRRPILKRILRKKVTTFYKRNAVNLGWVDDMVKHEVKMRFTSSSGVPNRSGYMDNMAAFTIQDRDNAYMNIWLLLLSALFNSVFGAILGAIAGGLVAYLVRKG